MADIDSISSGLQLGPDGIWYGAGTAETFYPPDGNDTCATVEEGSFWFAHRNSCIASAVTNHPPKNDGSIFDIGGGNGFVSLGLIRSGFDVVMVEPGATGCFRAKSRGVQNVICSTTDEAKFDQHSLPAVGLFDVVEHIEDDLAFLKSIRTLVEKGGHLYTTVPAYPILWSDEDVAAGHFRRYTLDGFSALLESAGFEIEYATYVFRFLPLPILLLRTIPYRLGLSKAHKRRDRISRDHKVGRGWWRALLDAVLLRELRNIENEKTMRFGGSCLVVAKSI